MTPFTTDQIKHLITAMHRKGYIVYTDGRLNLVGIRLNHAVTNRFDDELVAFTTDGGVSMDCTTDPGSYYMTHPMNDRGTAVLVPGQYVDCYAIGKHKGYEAIVQVRPVTVYRDWKDNGTLDYENPETGMFGINIHRANAVVRSKQVDKWSAGCTVVADPTDFSHLLYMAKNSTREFGPDITYTLMEEADLNDA